MTKTLIKNAQVINRGKSFKADVLIVDDIIEEVFNSESENINADIVIDATGLTLIPGVIDDQVHFREPGLTNKGDIFTESRAAAAGGVTSFMDMPNTMPPTTSLKLLDEKFDIASKNSLINYSFYLGANNDNLDEIKNVNPEKIPGVKIFLGSSTGNMLVNDEKVIESIFNNSPVLCAIHSEDDQIIENNLTEYKNKYGDNIPFSMHPKIRSTEACLKSTERAIKIAQKTNCRLHILHISTAEELGLLQNKSLKEKRITAEVCVHHLWFNSEDYDKLGAKIKWNPAIKDESDRLALIQALKTGKIDIVATDHAPHTKIEKGQKYLKAPSGGPMIQHSLPVMIELSKQGHFSIEEVVKYMCHNPADLFSINKRGYIEKGYYADIVLINTNKNRIISKDNLLYKCEWSPLEGQKLSSSIEKTLVNGKVVYENGKIIEQESSKALKYNQA